MLQEQHMKEFSVAVSLKDELLRSGNVMFTNKGVSMGASRVDVAVIPTERARSPFAR